jgi:hypothetical protein
MCNTELWNVNMGVKNGQNTDLPTSCCIALVVELSLRCLLYYLVSCLFRFHASVSACHLACSIWKFFEDKIAYNARGKVCI